MWLSLQQCALQFICVCEMTSTVCGKETALQVTARKTTAYQFYTSIFVLIKQATFNIQY